MKYFGTDGIRQPAADFTPDFLNHIVCGLADYANSLRASANPAAANHIPKVFLAGDTRESTEWILQDLAQALESCGFEYSSAGVLPTPAINYCFYQMGYDFAIDVTASHNPYTDNGIKIFERGENSGVKLSSQGCEFIESAIMSQKTVPLVSPTPREDLHDEAVSLYEKHLLDYLAADHSHADASSAQSGSADHAPSSLAQPGDGASSTLSEPTGHPESSALSESTDHPASSTLPNFSALSISIDSANGATSSIASSVFTKLGAKVHTLNANSTYGDKINANCGSTHPEALINAVTKHHLDFGVAFDGDGDRCLLVDHTGALVDGDEIIAIIAHALHLSSAAVTVMTNQGFINWANAHGIHLEITPVGDTSVAVAMRAHHIPIGGEQSGHIILPGEPTGDGILTALMLAKIISEQKAALIAAATSNVTPNATSETATANSVSSPATVLHDLTKLYTKLPQVSITMPATAQQKSALTSSDAVSSILAQFEEKVKPLGGRLLVRPSGTEPLIRITVWGDDAAAIDSLSTELRDALSTALANQSLDSTVYAPTADPTSPSGHP